MLVLPTGQILFSNDGSRLAVYTPDGTPVAAGKPTVSFVYGNSDGSYTLNGTTLNGINAGASYGDDAEMDSNYPIIRLTKGSNVYYARTYNWNATGVGGNGATSTQFNLPSGLAAGTYALSVVANGIASTPAEFTLWQSYQPAYSTASFSQISVGVAPNGPEPEVYGIGTDNNIYDVSNPSTPLVAGWQFKWIAAAPQYTPSGAEVFGLGEDNRIYYTTNAGSGWNSWQLYGDPNAHYYQISAGLAPDGSSPEVYGMGMDYNIYDATSNSFTPLEPGTQFNWIAAAPQGSASGGQVFGLGLTNQVVVTTYHSSPPPSPPPPLAPAVLHSFVPASVRPANPGILVLPPPPPGSQKEDWTVADQVFALGIGNVFSDGDWTKEMAGTNLQQSQPGSVPGLSQPLVAILNWPRQLVRFDDAELGQEHFQTSHQIADDDTLEAKDVS